MAMPAGPFWPLAIVVTGPPPPIGAFITVSLAKSVQ
jgi:hypothetical protein